MDRYEQVQRTWDVWLELLSCTIAVVGLFTASQLISGMRYSHHQSRLVRLMWMTGGAIVFGVVTVWVRSFFPQTIIYIFNFPNLNFGI